MDSTAAAASFTAAPSTVSWLDTPTPVCSLIPSLFTKQDDIYSFNHSEYRVEAIPDADIAGIGIICAFLITAYAVFIWMLVAYICGWLPSSLLGAADRVVFKRTGTTTIAQPWWQKAIDKAVLGYADQQIIYGWSILIAGFIQWGTISVYHYHVVIYLAWMSSNTHLSAVTLLPWIFHDAKRNIVRMLRLAGMSIVAIMLVAALVPTTRRFWFLTAFNWSDLPAGVPAHCFWHSEYAGTFEKDSLWSFLIVIGSCIFTGAQLFGLSQQAKKFEFFLLGGLAKTIDRILEKLEKNKDTRRRPWLLLRYKLTVNLYAHIWFVSELSKSLTVSLWMCGAGLAWGSLKLLLVRRSIGADVLNAENIWSFGQSLALLLVTIPMIAFLESVSDEKHKGERVKEVAKHVKDLLKHPHQQSLRASHHSRPPEPLPVPDLEALLDGSQSTASSVFPAQIYPTHATSSFHNNEDIYSRRFTKGLFWVAQLCAAWVVFLFDVMYYYFEIHYNAVELSEAQFPKGEHSRMVIFGALGTLAVMSLWFLCGMAFSSLFRPKAIKCLPVFPGT